MGVKGLWQLLLPTGRRISIETLSGKRLAVDASIWLTQFLKANRDPETGAVRANAHLIGFLRRLARMLFNGIRPVLVFDGATPEIKLREVRARRERRERLKNFKGDDDDEGVKRLARRLLIANLRKQKELEKAQEKMEGGKKVKNPMEVIRNATSQGAKSTGAFASGFRLPGEEDDVHMDNAEEGVRSEKDGGISSQRKALDKDSPTCTSKEKTKKCDTDTDAHKETEVLVLSDSEDYLKCLTQKQQNANNDWDAALDAAETESEHSESSIDIPDDAEDLDIDTLTTLPSKSRVDIIEKARRQQRMNSRQEFMSVAANPESYSQCQLKNFLKSATLNRKVSNLGKIVARKGEDGLEGERIASDGSKRFIFSKDQGDEADDDDGSGGETKYSENDHRKGSLVNSITEPIHLVRLHTDGAEASYSSDEGGFVRENDGQHSSDPVEVLKEANNRIIELASSDKSEEGVQKVHHNDIIDLNSDSDSNGGGFIPDHDISDNDGGFVTNERQESKLSPNLHDTSNKNKSDEDVNWEDGNDGDHGEIDSTRRKSIINLDSDSGSNGGGFIPDHGSDNDGGFVTNERQEREVSSNHQIRNDVNNEGESDEDVNWEDGNDGDHGETDSTRRKSIINLDSDSGSNGGGFIPDHGSDNDGVFVTNERQEREVSSNHQIRNDANNEGESDEDVNWEDGDDGDMKNIETGRKEKRYIPISPRDRDLSLPQKRIKACIDKCDEIVGEAVVVLEHVVGQCDALQRVIRTDKNPDPTLLSEQNILLSGHTNYTSLSIEINEFDTSSRKIVIYATFK